jgi:hypothetical protein
MMMWAQGARGEIKAGGLLFGLTACRWRLGKQPRGAFSLPRADALKRLAKTIGAGRLKDRNKMERRLGGIQARHSSVRAMYEVGLRDTPEGDRLFWQVKEDRQNWRKLREGSYMLRTNLKADTAEQLWSHYIQLTEAEASFRALKRHLSIRPSSVPSTRAAGQGPRHGGISRLRTMGDAQADRRLSSRDAKRSISRTSGTIWRLTRGARSQQPTATHTSQHIRGQTACVQAGPTLPHGRTRQRISHRWPKRA